MSCLVGDEYPYTELFCEGRWGGLFRGVSDHSDRYLPEWGNAISAVFISIVGMVQLIGWDHDSTTIRMCSSLFVVNGWSSLLNHVTGYVWWSFVDGMSMVIVVFLVLALVIEEWSQERFGRPKDFGSPEAPMNMNVRTLRALLWVAASSLMWIVMVDRLEGCASGGFNSFPGLFELGFGASIVVIIVLIVVEYKTQRAQIAASTDDLDRAWFHLKVGIGVAVIGTLMWIATENLCDDVKFFRWFPGHIFWHLLMTYGLGNVMMFITFIRANDAQSTASFYTPEHRVARLWCRVFPMVVWRNWTDPHRETDIRAHICVRCSRSQSEIMTPPDDEDSQVRQVKVQDQHIYNLST